MVCTRPASSPSLAGSVTPPGTSTQAGAGDPIADLVDAFACIMCNRCQDVCPAYVTGKELSPAALEVLQGWMPDYSDPQSFHQLFTCAGVDAGL